GSPYTNYKYRLTSAGCSDPATFDRTLNIIVNALPATSLSFDDIKFCQGDLAIEPTFAAPAGYSITWIPGAPADVKGLAGKATPYTYEYKFKNIATQCEDASNRTLTVTVNELPSANIIAQSDSEYTKTNGSVKIEGVGANPFTYSFEGGLFAAKNVFTGLAAPVTYTITVKDNNGCTFDINVPIGKDPKPSDLSGIIISKTDSEKGKNNGSLEVEGKDGEGEPYTYSIEGNGITKGPQDNGLFKNLPPGDYEITIKDGKDTYVVGVRIDEIDNTKLTGVIVAQENSDEGKDNGMVQVEGRDGKGPYKYAIGDGDYQKDGTFTDLAPGDYIVTIKDDAGKTYKLPVTIGEKPERGTDLTGDVLSITDSERGEDNGEIIVQGRLGTGPYCYAIKGDRFQCGDGKFPGLEPGDYTIIIRDAEGDTFELTVRVGEEPSDLSGIVVSITDSEKGKDNGVIVVEGKDGKGPSYEYTIKDETGTIVGGPQKDDGTFPNLKPGDYVVTIKDANNDTYEVGVRVGEEDNTDLTAVIVGQENSEKGGATGTVTVKARKGKGPYTYSIDGSNPQTNNTGEFTGLPEGDYIVTVKDEGTGKTFEVPVTIGEKPGAGEDTDLIGDVLEVITSEYGKGNGKIRVQGRLGTPDYEYFIDGKGPNKDGGLFENLEPGDYLVTIKDQDGNIFEVTVRVGEDPKPSDLSGVVVSITDSEKGKDNGKVVVEGKDGDGGPYTYVIKDETGTVVDGPKADGTFPNLTAGDYEVTIKDGTGATYKVGVRVDEVDNTDLTAVIVGQENSEKGGATGTVTVKARKGKGPYTYSIDGSNPQTNSTGEFTGLPEGDYIVTVTDESTGKTFEVPVTIGEKPDKSTDLTGDVISITDSRYGKNDGEIEVQGRLGTGPYEYFIEGSKVPNKDGGKFKGLAPNDYEITIKDAVGDTYKVTVRVGEEPEPSNLSGIVISITDSKKGKDNGKVEVKGILGAGPYDYFIDGKGPNENGGKFDNLAPGDYEITIKDKAGDTYTVGVRVGEEDNTDLTAVIVGQENSEEGKPTGMVEVEGKGGEGPYTYTIKEKTGTPISGPKKDDGKFENLKPGDYVVIVEDSEGTKVEVPVTIGKKPAHGTDLTGDVIELIESERGKRTGSVEVQGRLGTGPYKYSINGKDFQGDGKFDDLAPGDYTVTIKDAKGETFEINVRIGETCNPAIAIAFSPLPQVCKNSERIPLREYIHIPLFESYAFSGNEVVGEDFIVPDKVGDYYVTLTATMVDGCVGSVTRVVEVRENEYPVAFAFDNNKAICVGAAPYDLLRHVAPAGGKFSGAFVTEDGIFTPSTAGVGVHDVTYTVVKNGCTGTGTAKITVKNSGETDIAFVQVAKLCTNAGTIDLRNYVAPAGGLFSGTGVVGINFNPAQAVVGINNVTYTVNANGCTDTKTIPIEVTNQNCDELTGVIVKKSDSEYAKKNGSVEVKGSGGTAPYEYSIDGCEYRKFQSSGVFENLAPCAYIVTVKDATGKTFQVPVIIGEDEAPKPSDLSGKILSKTDSDYRKNNGSVTVTGLKGAPDYEYAIEGCKIRHDFTPNGGVFEGLAPCPEYRITVKDSKGATHDMYIAIGELPTDLFGEVLSTTNSDYEKNNGTAEITGVKGSAPYQYSLDGQTFLPSGVFTNLAPGDYEVVVKDAVGSICKVQFTIEEDLDGEIVEPCLPVAMQKDNHTIVVNNNKATNGGYTFVSYTWYYKNGVAIDAQNSGKGLGYFHNAEVDKKGVDLIFGAKYYAVVVDDKGKEYQTCPVYPEKETVAAVTVFPTPLKASEHVNIKLEGFNWQETEIWLYSISGALQSVTKATGDVTPIPVPKSQGAYVVKILSGTQVIEKIIMRD
ncbi:MAG: hypothetical protein FWC39_09155, partial [Bacteroidetes bacterium]|nr:hypothetical protein [Bacteroidota bacterium]